jgi:hypothetical protein
MAGDGASVRRQLRAAFPAPLARQVRGQAMRLCHGSYGCAARAFDQYLRHELIAMAPARRPLGVHMAAKLSRLEMSQSRPPEVWGLRCGDSRNDGTISMSMRELDRLKTIQRVVDRMLRAGQGNSLVAQACLSWTTCTKRWLRPQTRRGHSGGCATSTQSRPLRSRVQCASARAEIHTCMARQGAL